MNHESFRQTWDSVTLSSESDARIRQALICSDKKYTPITKVRNLPKLVLAAVLSVLALVITAGAIAIARLELTVQEDHTAVSNQYDIFISSWEGTNTPLDSWYPEALPKDFAPVYISDLQDSNRSIVFQNKQGDRLELKYCTSSVQILDSTRGSRSSRQDITINGVEGYRFDHDCPEELGLTACTLLCWTAPDKDVAFSLEYRGTGDLAPDLLIIAESVAPQTESLTPSLYDALDTFGDWRITALPENYVYDRARCYYLEDLLDEERPFVVYQTFLREDSIGGKISLQYHPIPSQETSTTALEDITAFFRDDRTPASIHGNSGYYVNSTKAAADHLYWVDEESGLIFTLSTESISQKEAMALAESIRKY